MFHRRYKTLLILFAAFLFTQPLLAQDEEPQPTTLDELKSAIEAVREKQNVPAVGIAMVNRDGPVWIGALGKANLEQDIDADEETMFRIGSTSKMFVALAVLKLVEEGRLSLDDTVAELAPEVEFENPWEATDPVRVVHLLEHTTGWDDIHLTEYAHNDPTPATLKEGLDFHPHSRISRWQPGTRFAYCNAGPPVAARIVENITGQDFEDYVAENFFEPMGMETMTYRLTPDYEQHGATLYTGDSKPEKYWHIIMRPSGAINASPRDMAKFLDFYLQRGEVNGQQLVSETSLKRMETPTSTNGAMAGLEMGYGLHNYATSHEGWVYRDHGGGVNGGLTEFAYLPEAALGHAIMINSDNGAALKEISDLVRGFEIRNLPHIAVSRERTISDQNLAIEGYYYPINPRQQDAFFMERILGMEKLWFDGDRLARKGLLGGKTAYFYPMDDRKYKSAETGRIALVTAVDPLAGEVVQASTTTLKPASGLQVYTQLAIAFLWGLVIASTLLFFLVWIVRKLRGKIPAGATIRVRLWPLLASASVVGFVGLFLYGFGDPFKLLATKNIVSISILVLSIAFAVFAVMGVLTSIRERHAGMNRIAYWHSTIASVTHLVVLGYLLWFGVIGIRLWA